MGQIVEFVAGQDADTFLRLSSALLAGRTLMSRGKETIYALKQNDVCHSFILLGLFLRVVVFFSSSCLFPGAPETKKKKNPKNSCKRGEL